jgi:hypothetical protein
MNWRNSLCLLIGLAWAGAAVAEDYFPLAVWVQAPANAEKYHAIGINTYVGLWSGPTAAQLDTLEKAGMRVVCHYRKEFVDRKSIVGWMHGDEPDNAQAQPKGQKGYGPPILPEKIVADYKKLKEADPSRPVMLNLGQGVAYDNYIGRGVRRGKLEDYPKYIEGCDIVSFDIYPTNHDKPEIAGKLEVVAKGVTRLGEWSKDQKVVWNCIETTNIHDEGRKPTPHEIRAEVWMSIVHGSRGIIYFAHQFKPKFIEAGILADAGTSAALSKVNAEVTSLAGAINEAPPAVSATVTSSNAAVPVAVMTRRHGGKAYVFAVSMRGGDGPTTATFTLPGAKAGAVEVIGEGRNVTAGGGTFADGFAPYEVHLYRVAVD